MNFISHFRAFTERLDEDHRLNTTHVAMYVALFDLWNQHRFRSPIPLLRADMMHMSKIRSTNTYAYVLRDLHEWGYIRYEPSGNSHRPSMVHLFPFYELNTSAENAAESTGKTPARDTSKSRRPPSRPHTVQVLQRFLFLHHL